MKISEKIKIPTYDIYIGLNDADTRQQKFDTDRYFKIVKNVLKNYKVGFSIKTSTGGYFHDDGDFVQENSIVVTLIGAKEDNVNEIAADLCAFFNQEEVMVSASEIETYSVREGFDF